MNHKQLKLLSSSYVDGEVTGNEKHLVEKHLKSCSECRTFVDQIYVMRKSIKELGDVKLSPAFAACVLDKVVKQEEQSDKWLGIEHLARNAVFAIALAVIILFFVPGYSNETSQGISEVLIDGNGRDSVAVQMLLHPGKLSKNDFLYAVMTK